MVKTLEKEFDAGLWKQIMVDYLLLSALNWFILHTSLTLYVPFSIWMWCWYHLREINHSDMIIIIQYEIKFIEITMNQTMIAKFYN